MDLNVDVNNNKASSKRRIGTCSYFVCYDFIDDYDV